MSVVDQLLARLPANPKVAAYVLIGEAQKYGDAKDVETAALIAFNALKVAGKSGYVTHVYESSILLFQFLMDLGKWQQASEVLKAHHALLLSQGALSVLPRETYLRQLGFPVREFVELRTDIDRMFPQIRRVRGVDGEYSLLRAQSHDVDFVPLSGEGGAQAQDELDRFVTAQRLYLRLCCLRVLELNAFERESDELGPSLDMLLKPVSGFTQASSDRFALHPFRFAVAFSQAP